MYVYIKLQEEDNAKQLYLVLKVSVRLSVRQYETLSTK